jgi:hypothetical protein
MTCPAARQPGGRDASWSSRSTTSPSGPRPSTTLRSTLPSATTAVRFRCGPATAPLGYAMTGAAGRRGYAAAGGAPRRAGADRCGTPRRRAALGAARARDAVVNTDRTNRTAALYESHGFVDLPTGLVVLERAL